MLTDARFLNLLTGVAAKDRLYSGLEVGPYTPPVISPGGRLPSLPSLGEETPEKPNLFFGP